MEVLLRYMDLEDIFESKRFRQLWEWNNKENFKNMFKFSFKKSFWKIIFAVDSAPHGRRLDAILFWNASTVDRWPNTHLISFPLPTGNTFSRRFHHKKDRMTFLGKGLQGNSNKKSHEIGTVVAYIPEVIWLPIMIIFSELLLRFRFSDRVQKKLFLKINSSLFFNLLKTIKNN